MVCGSKEERISVFIFNKMLPDQRKLDLFKLTICDINILCLRRFFLFVVAEILDVDVNIRFVCLPYLVWLPLYPYFLISIFGNAPNMKYSLNCAENHKIFIFLDILF